MYSKTKDDIIRLQFRTETITTAQTELLENVGSVWDKMATMARILRQQSELVDDMRKEVDLLKAKVNQLQREQGYAMELDTPSMGDGWDVA